MSHGKNGPSVVRFRSPVFFFFFSQFIFIFDFSFHYYYSIVCRISIVRKKLPFLILYSVLHKKKFLFFYFEMNDSSECGAWNIEYIRYFSSLTPCALPLISHERSDLSGWRKKKRIKSIKNYNKKRNYNINYSQSISCFGVSICTNTLVIGPATNLLFCYSFHIYIHSK